MNEHKTIEEVQTELIYRLRDFTFFKKMVKRKSKLESFALAAFGISAVLLIYNLIASVRAMFEYDIPWEYFGDVFMDDTDSNIVFYVFTIIALIVLIPAGIAWITQRVRLKKDYENFHEKFLANPTISKEYIVRVSNEYYASFDKEEDTQKMNEYLLNNTFAEDKKFRKFTKANYIQQNTNALSKYLTKNFDIHSKIKAIYSVKRADIFTCSDGVYRLFLDDGREHPIHYVPNETM